MDYKTPELVKKSEGVTSCKFENELLILFKQHIEDYVRTENLKKDVCPKANLYLEKAKHDEELLLDYLKGRKNNVEFAWNTLKLSTENRFKQYPDVYATERTEKLRNLLKSGFCGLLKNRDMFGRRIVFFNIMKWDTNEYTFDDFIVGMRITGEIFWRDRDILENGVVLVENTEGFSAAHAKQLSLHKLLKIRAIVRSFPISIQGIFYLNMPYLFNLAFNMFKPVFAKRIRSRIVAYSSTQTPHKLHDIASPEILPAWMGGKLSIEEAAEDITFFDKRLRTLK